jgi:hypothetical protein
VLDLLFAPLYLALLFVVWRIKEPFTRSHAIFFVLFCPLLHFATLVTGQVTSTYSPYGNVTAHLIVFSYVALFFAGAISLSRHLPHASQIIAFASRVSGTTVSLVLSAWVAIKFYLVAKYGVSAFLVLGTVAGEDKLLFIDPLDAAVSAYAGYFAVGVAVAYFIRVVSGSIKWNNPTSIVVVTFLIAYVMTGETPLGARRFILLLVILCLSIAVAQRAIRATGKRSRPRVFGLLVLSVLVVGGFSMYYQSVRTNFYSEQNTQRLLSGEPLAMLSAVVDSIVPANERNSDSEEQAQLRPGPFELLGQLSDRLLDGRRTTDGEIIWRSVQTVIPRIWMTGEKEPFSTDIFVSVAFDVEPEGQYVDPDLPMSLAAISLADFGFIGVLIAPIVMLLAISLMSYTLKSLAPLSAAYVIVIFGAMFQMIGIVEGELIAFLATLREFIALIVLVSLARALLTVGREVLIYSTRRVGLH